MSHVFAVMLPDGKHVEIVEEQFVILMNGGRYFQLDLNEMLLLKARELDQQEIRDVYINPKHITRLYLSETSNLT